MREDEVDKVKHVCKFCDKSFPSGRQLGGHMRSHLNHNNSVDGDGIGNQKKKRRRMRKRKRVDSGDNSEGGAGSRSGGGSRAAYVLRENPRKRWRLVAEEDMWPDQEKSCRECRRGFGSWKALFGHMKRHAVEDQDSRTSNDQEAVLVEGQEDSRLDDEDKEEVAVPGLRRRSERRKRYMVVTASSSSLSLVNINDDGSHNVVSSIDQEQEELAMCLMMLSRDIGHRKAADSVIAESSKRSSPDAKKGSGGSINGNSGSDNSEIKNEVQFQSRDDLPDFGSAKDSNSPQGSRTDHPLETKVTEIIDRKRSLSSDLNDTELGMKTQKEFADDDEVGFGLLSERIWVNSDKRSRFECKTCNKVFHSYQALGGHKASHSKIKDCFDRNIRSETEISHPAKAQKMFEKRANGVAGKKHECRVCLKVFPSGQALGGHKRSHMQPGEGTSNEYQQVVAVKPVSSTRDAFDLNLPAQIEDKGSSHVTFNSWCGQS